METGFVVVRTVGGICLVLIGLVFLRVKRVERMRNAVDAFLVRFAEFERRALVVEAEAVTYVNSMDKEVTSCIYEIRQILGRGRQVVHGVEGLLGLGTYYGLSRASRLVNGELLKPNDICGGASRSGINSWEEYLEEAIQFVGSRVASAAQRSSALGYPGTTTPSQTLRRLTAAGIIYRDE
jgi:hypothetical protein